MKRGAPSGLLKIVRQEFREAWRGGLNEGRREVAEVAVPAILSARFGLESDAFAAFVRFTNDDRLVDLVELAATCLDLDDFYARVFERKRRRKS